MQARCSVSFKSAVDDEQKKIRAINRVNKPLVDFQRAKIKSLKKDKSAT